MTTLSAMINTTYDFPIGCASVKGPSRPLNCDALAHHVFRDRLAIAVVDGTGSRPDVAEFAAHAAATAVRVAARRSPVYGIVTASELYDDPSTAIPSPSGAVVVATTEPNGLWLVAWAGDSVAYGVDNGEARRLTTPQTMGQLLRDQGAPEEEARAADHQLMQDLARVPRYGVEGIEAESELLILASDGLRLDCNEIAAIAIQHIDPQSCATALVEAAQERGSKDDITALVATQPLPKIPSKPAK